MIVGWALPTEMAMGGGQCPPYGFLHSGQGCLMKKQTSGGQGGIKQGFADEKNMVCILETFPKVSDVIGPEAKKEILSRCLRCVKDIPKSSEFLSGYQLCVELTTRIENPSERKWLLLSIAGELPNTAEFHHLYIEVLSQAIRAANAIEDPKSRKDALLDIIHELPQKHDFQPLYLDAMNHAIKAADEIRDSQHRVHALLSIADEIPNTLEYNSLRLRTFKLALNLATNMSQPQYEQHRLNHIAKTLPKTSDIEFYRQYTLLGIAKEIPKTGEFLNLYKDAIKLAIAAAVTIEEPYYRKYALCYIAEELSGTPDLMSLYKHTMKEAFKAASAIVEPLVRVHALIDILKLFPKTTDFFPQLQEALVSLLDFYTVRKRIKDVTPIEVIDFILLMDEKGVRDSKKTKFTKEKYAHILAKDLEQFGLLLNDIRFIEVLKPYTHVWIQPKALRASVSKIVDHLEALKNTYHGKEMERPCFISELFLSRQEEPEQTSQAKTVIKECMSIDIGATNTVIMKRRWDMQPEYVELKAISKRYNDIPIVPTILNLKTGSIGAATGGDEIVSNFKKMLLEGHPNGKMYMERFFASLCKYLKEETKRPLWLSVFSNSLTDKLYMTTPIGFPDYKKAVKEAIERNVKGIDVEILEEPLAAALGYQMAEEDDKIALLIDFGGSTLDVMVVRLNINEAHVVAKPDRSKILGGYDIDLWITDYLFMKLGKLGRDGDKPPRELIDKAEEIKIALSDSKEVTFRWNNYDVCNISRNDFEEILDKHGFYSAVDRSISYVLWKAEKVGVRKEKIEAILLTGGSSQIPSFKEKISAVFPNLYKQNCIYNHSPFSAVAIGASLYATRKIRDKHLRLAYAIRYKTKDKDIPFAYEIIFEKGESFPFEKTFKINPARTLGGQGEIYIELFEVPDKYIIRRWEKEGGMEYIKQVIKTADDMVLKDLKIITLYFDETVEDETTITFCVDETGNLRIRYGKLQKEVETEVRLQ